MTTLKHTVRINGEIYTDAQLQRYEYERTLHTLHELKRLGASIALTHSELNWLPPEQAKTLLLQTKLDLTPQGMENLLKDVLADSDRRWKTWATSEPIEQQGVWMSHTEFEFEGVTIQAFQQMMHNAELAWGLRIMPEHYLFEGAVSSGTQRIMETFGCFGEPTDTVGRLAPVPDYVPFVRDERYPHALIGEVFLKSDDTRICLGAVHELAPTENGFMQKSTFWCPKNAPKAVADGHTLHFAIEVVNGIKDAMKSQK